MSEDILVKIGDYAKVRVQEAEKNVSSDEMKKQALSLDPDTGFPFEKALARPGLSFICECKKASPSKGLIAEDYDYLSIAKDYEKAGADCISVLTEPKWFLGSASHLKEISDAVSIPCLRKDFVVDEYMIYHAKVLGASCVLLICAILDEDTIGKYIKICDSLGLSAIVEAHDEKEIRQAENAGARIIGVNNRNLRDFSVDLSNAADLESAIPKDALFVAESGIRNAEDADFFRKKGADAVLIGEALMRAEDRKTVLAEMKGTK